MEPAKQPERGRGRGRGRGRARGRGRGRGDGARGRGGRGRGGAAAAGPGFEVKGRGMTVHDIINDELTKKSMKLWCGADKPEYVVVVVVVDCCLFFIDCWVVGLIVY